MKREEEKRAAKNSLLKDFQRALAEQEERKNPNELDSTCGVGDEELVKRFHEAIEQENEDSRARGLPVTGYDRVRKASYIEYPDGRRVYGDET